MSEYYKATRAGKLLSLLVIICLAGCQQMQGSRIPSKPGRNSSDPFLGSPMSRIPPTPVPPVALGSKIAEPACRLDARPSAAGESSRGESLSRNDLTTGFQTVAWKDNSSKSTSWEEIFRELRAKGVTWQRLEMQGNQWRFDCTAPHPTNPQEIREYFATASDPLSAVQAVLQKLDNPAR